jgi:hypothetical protein
MGPESRDFLKFELETRWSAAGRSNDVTGSRVSVRVEVEDDPIHGENSDLEEMEPDDFIGNGSIEDVGKISLDRERFRGGAEKKVEGLGHMAGRNKGRAVRLGNPETNRGSTSG